MNFKVIIIRFQVLIMIFYLSGCRMQDRNDIYHYVPKGTKLSKELLMSSEQVVLNKNALILTYPISWDSEFYANHLLFFNSNMILKNACYFPTFIDSIKKNTIYGISTVFSEGLRRKDWYRKDTPSNYKIVLNIGEYPNHCGTGLGNRCNKIIEKIEFNKTDLSVFLFVKRTKNIDENIDWQKENKKIYFYNQFEIKKTLRIPLSNLIFNHKEKVVSTIFFDNDSMWKLDEMPVINDSIYNDLYIQLWSYLSN